MNEHNYEIVTAHGLELIHRLPDGAFIPKDPENCDYMKYLQWVDNGNIAPMVEQATEIGNVE